MTRRRARMGIWRAAAILLAPWALLAADPGPQKLFASVALKDGRVLHNVKVMTNEPADLVVHADEGLLKIAKTNLPAAVAEVFPVRAAPVPPPALVMHPFNPDLMASSVAQDQSGKIPMKPLPEARPDGGSIYKGCSIIRFEMKAFQGTLGCAEVVIRNDTENASEVTPRDFVCITTSGERHIGRAIVSEGYPVTIKRIEIVPAHSDVTDIVTFTSAALEISYVQWSR